jgi:hypothetical protein
MSYYYQCGKDTEEYIHCSKGLNSFIPLKPVSKYSDIKQFIFTRESVDKPDYSRVHPVQTGSALFTLIANLTTLTGVENSERKLLSESLGVKHFVVEDNNRFTFY